MWALVSIVAICISVKVFNSGSITGGTESTEFWTSKKRFIQDFFALVAAQLPNIEMA